MIRSLSRGYDRDCWWLSSNVKIGGYRGQMRAASAQPFARHAVRMAGLSPMVSDRMKLMIRESIIASRERRAVRNVRQSLSLDEDPRDRLISSLHLALPAVHAVCSGTIS